jgi:hypothetical protein
LKRTVAVPRGNQTKAHGGRELDWLV